MGQRADRIFGAKPVDWNTPQKIIRLDIVGFMNRLAGLKRSGTTRARKLASIRHFLKFLKENGVIAGNPAETVIRARKEEKDPTVLFKNEYKALLFEAQGNSRDYAILLTFLKSGIRESELADLQIEDVDFVHDTLRVREPEFEEPRHTSASSRRQNKENQGGLRLFCFRT